MIVQMCLRERGSGACQLEAAAEKNHSKTQALQWNPSGSEEPDRRELADFLVFLHWSFWSIKSAN